jgi:hypothetical protein
MLKIQTIDIPYLTEMELLTWRIFPYWIWLRFKSRPSLLETVGLRVPARNLIDISLLNVSPSNENWPTSSESAPNVVCRYFDDTKVVSLSYFSITMVFSNLLAINSTLYIFKYIFSCLTHKYLELLLSHKCHSSVLFVCIFLCLYSSFSFFNSCLLYNKPVSCGISQNVKK